MSYETVPSKRDIHGRTGRNSDKTTIVLYENGCCAPIVYFYTVGLPKKEEQKTCYFCQA